MFIITNSTNITIDDIKKGTMDYISKTISTQSIEIPIISITHSKNKIEIIKRVLSMYALSLITDDIDKSVIKKWVLQNKLYQFLSNEEKEILYKGKDRLSEHQIEYLKHYKEGVWAGLWVLEFIDEIQPHTPISIERVIEYTPSITQNQFAQTFLSKAKMLPTMDIYRMYYLYLTLHAISFDNEERVIKDIHLKNGNIIQGNIIYGRLMMLTWILDPKFSDWDNINTNNLMKSFY